MRAVLQDLRAVLGAKPAAVDSGTATSILSSAKSAIGTTSFLASTGYGTTGSSPMKGLAASGVGGVGSRVDWLQRGEKVVRDSILLFYLYVYIV